MSRSLAFGGFVVLMLAGMTAPAFGQASFQGLGDLPGRSFHSVANGVSADGSVVVGRGDSGSGVQAFRWESGVMIGLGDLPGGFFHSQAINGSADGSVVVGYSHSVLGYEAFRWESGVMIGLGDFPFPGDSIANDVSADGSVVVGRVRSFSGYEAFRWENGVMTSLGDLPGGSIFSSARGVSANGSVIVGMGRSDLGDEAFRWENGVMIGLGYLPGGGFDSLARAISADGSVVVGDSDSSSGSKEAFRWENDVMTGLGYLPGGSVFSSGLGVSADGSVVVGVSDSSSGNGAFIWDSVSGMRSLRDVLVNNLNLDLTGWKLTQASGISNDGLTIVGCGKNPNGLREGWIARMPAPIAVFLDIKPGGCPNPLNRRSKGVLPMVLLGTAEFDVTGIDPGTLQLSRADGVGGSVGPLDGPPGPHPEIEDLATPFGGDTCDCHHLQEDGIDDLSLKFNANELVSALQLGEMSGGAVVELVVTGQLIDGRRFAAKDCVRLVPPADIDADGDVDGSDFVFFAACFNKSGHPPRGGCSPLQIEAFDFDADGDVDAVDFAVFASCFNKAGNPPRTLGCPQN